MSLHKEDLVPAYELIRHPSDAQDETSLSHIGGLPNLPQRFDLPTCELCHAEMTFFFQVKFPEKHDWAEKIMAIFACTSCVSWDYMCPPMPPGGRHLGLPDHFLEEYEKTFRTIVFESSENSLRRKEYLPILKYEYLELRSLQATASWVTRIGGKPNWRISNDSPKEYMGSRFTFLMQIFNDKFDWEFEKLPDAPQQAQYPFLGDPYRTDDKYALFGGVPLYFFGTLDLEIPKVYVLNQK